jgi:hypothetical protein
MNSEQIRIRIPNDIAFKLRSLSISERNQVIAAILRANVHQFDLTALTGMRKELTSLGTLINQSLRTTWGMETNREAAELVIQKLQNLFRS